MVVPFLLALAEAGTFQSLIQRFHRDLISIGAIRIFLKLCIGRGICLDSLHSGSHEEPQISLAAQRDDGGHISIFHGQLGLDDLEHRRTAVGIDLIDALFDLIRIFGIAALRTDQCLSRPLIVRRNHRRQLSLRLLRLLCRPCLICRLCLLCPFGLCCLF